MPVYFVMSPFDKIVLWGAAIFIAFWLCGAFFKWLFTAPRASTLPHVAKLRPLPPGSPRFGVGDALFLMWLLFPVVGIIYGVVRALTRH